MNGNRYNKCDRCGASITPGEAWLQEPPAQGVLCRDCYFASGRVGGVTVSPEGGKRSVRESRHYHSIHHTFLNRVATRHSQGDARYGEYNWRKGLPWQDTFNHIIAHLYHWKSLIELGEVPTDDDLAGAAVGIEFLMFREHEYAEQQAKMAVTPEPYPPAPTLPGSQG